MRVFLAKVCMILFLVLSDVNAQSLLENNGRFNENIVFTKHFQNGMSYFTKTGYVVLLKNMEDNELFWHDYHLNKKIKKDYIQRYHRFDVNFLGANFLNINKEKMEPSYFNFYKNDIKATNTKSYGKITYLEFYKGIDWEIEDYDRNIKHNFIVKPQANPKLIKIEYKYAELLKIENGALVIQTSVGNVIENKPYAYQIIGEDTIEISCNYHLTKTETAWTVDFRLGEYNKDEILVIDPILVFSTYSGSKGDNFGFTSTFDSKSHLYAAGIVDGGIGTNGGPFPVTVGAFQTVFSGGVGSLPASLPCDIGINKFDSAGNNLLFSTYIGGGQDEYPHSLVVDNFDQLIVFGTTYSQDFPTSQNAYSTTLKGQTDIFITKFLENGTDIVGSTYFGGAGYDGLNSRNLRYNYSDDYRGDVAVDSLNNIYIASTTESSNFPVKNALQSSAASLQDGCLFSFNAALTTLRFSSYMGGNSDDALYSVRIYDSFLYVAGGTSSNAMAFGVNGNKNAYSGGRADGFIAKLTLNGQLLHSTYFGTNSYDQIFFIDLDKDGQVFAAGQTEGNLARTANTYGKDNTSQFIVRFSPNLANINLSTTFGNRINNPEISPSAFLVDKCDNIYFSGWGSPITDGILHSLTTKGLPVSANAIQPTTDNKDFYLIVLNKNANNLLYATYFGGDKTEDHVDGGTSRFDKKGVVYQSVCASCPDRGGNQDFPVTPNVPFKTNLSKRCSNAAFKIDFQINFIVDAKFDANPKEGCLPLQVDFTNQSKSGRSFQWDFGDGSPIDTAKNPKHTFLLPGVFKVKLTSIDSFSCNVSEMDSTIITVYDLPKADFSFEAKPCSRIYQFKNKSENYTSIGWDFGDGTLSTSEENPKHEFLLDGNFKTILTVKHTNGKCQDTQSVIIALTSNPIGTIKMPNVFTPNKDNLNDCYTIAGLQQDCDDAEIWIYDRWGVLVFEGKMPQTCWNGNNKNTGETLSSGVYYYLLKIKSNRPQFDDKQTINGVIHLIR